MVREIRNVAVLGATGSIGRQTLDVIRRLGDRFRVFALAAGNNQVELTQQIAEFQPALIHLQDATSSLCRDHRCLSPEEMAAHPEVDIVVVATPGNSGLMPTLAAARAGKIIALANKESLVSAGDIIMAEAARSGGQIRPLDSEHSAIWQCLSGESTPPARIILTASGGPFRETPSEKLKEISVAAALAHPSWQMGDKVTIDSATLLNKGLEVIEAHRLFGVPLDRIEVLIHPQSIVHSLVEFADGTVKAQLSCPDMRLPIQYALTYPERELNPELPRLDWTTLRKLDFEPPDTERFPCLKLAIEAGEQGATYPAVLCAADEIAVALFLEGRLKFTDIATVIAGTLVEHSPPTRYPTLEDILIADSWARQTARHLATGEKPC